MELSDTTSEMTWPRIENDEYIKPGPSLFESGSFVNTINFYTPIDAIYNNAKLFVVSDDVYAAKSAGLDDTVAGGKHNLVGVCPLH